MALERWFIDGWELTAPGRGWEVREGTDGWAGMNGSDGDVPMRDGTLFRRRTLAAGTLRLSLWVVGADPEQVRANWSDVLRVVARRNRQVKITRHLPSGEVIYAHGSLTGTAEPVHLGQRGVRAQLSFTVQDGRWWSEQTYTHSTVTGTGVQTLQLPDFAPSTAPMLLTYTIKGTASHVRLRDYSDPAADTVDRSELTYSTDLLSTETLTIDTYTWKATSTRGGRPLLDKLTYSARRFLELEPAPPGGVPAVRFEPTGHGTTTKLTVTGRRAYLI